MNKMKKLAKSAKIMLLYISAKFFTLFIPIRKNKYFCIAMTGNSYGDSIKCLSDYIAEHDVNSQIVWAFTRDFYSMTCCEHKKVILYTFKYYYHISTSKYVLTNVSLNKQMFVKRRNQICIQTWHGTALKRIGTDMYKHKVSSASMITSYNARLTDIVVSGSRFMTDILHEKCLYPSDIISEIGTPRNDVFFEDRPDIREKVYSLYGLREEEKIILYAPTFRSDGSMIYYDVDLHRIKTILEEKYGGKYVIMIRLHPNLMKHESTFNSLFSSDIVNASFYPDMIDLLYSADVLITDYSSCMFDFMYSYNPVILYVPDRLTYDSGFYFDIDKMPFVIVNDNSEIEDKMLKFDIKNYKSKLENFMKEIGSVENGTATAKVYDIIKSF